MKPHQESTAYQSQSSHTRPRWLGTCVLLCTVALLPACGVWSWTKTQVSGSGWSTSETKPTKQVPAQTTAAHAQTPVQAQPAPAAPQQAAPAPSQTLSALPPPEPMPQASASEADILALQENDAPEVTPVLPPAPQPIAPPPPRATTVPLPPPAAAPTPPTQPLARGHYAAQVGVFFVHANALTIRDRIAAQLANEGTLNPSERAVRSIKKGKRTYVVVGDTASAKEAEALAQRLSLLLGQGVAVFKR